VILAAPLITGGALLGYQAVGTGGPEEQPGPKIQAEQPAKKNTPIGDRRPVSETAAQKDQMVVMTMSFTPTLKGGAKGPPVPIAITVTGPLPGSELEKVLRSNDFAAALQATPAVSVFDEPTRVSRESEKVQIDGPRPIPKMPRAAQPSSPADGSQYEFQFVVVQVEKDGTLDRVNSTCLRTVVGHRGEFVVGQLAPLPGEEFMNCGLSCSATASKVPGGKLRLDVQADLSNQEATGKDEAKILRSILRVVKIVNEGEKADLEMEEPSKEGPHYRLQVKARPVKD
jgi:hypothetical protein